jgi:hypothetical protein
VCPSPLLGYCGACLSSALHYALQLTVCVSIMPGQRKPSSMTTVRAASYSIPWAAATSDGERPFRSSSHATRLSATARSARGKTCSSVSDRLCTIGER